MNVAQRARVEAQQLAVGESASRLVRRGKVLRLAALFCGLQPPLGVAAQIILWAAAAAGCRWTNFCVLQTTLGTNNKP